MRDGKFRRFVYFIAKEEDVDIDDTRLIVSMFPESPFDGFHVVEELVRTELGLRFDGHVVKIWLFTYSLRLRDINRTAFCDVDVRGDFFERCAHVGDAVAEVGPESEVYCLHKGHGSAARRLLLEFSRKCLKTRREYMAIANHVHRLSPRIATLIIFAAFVGITIISVTLVLRLMPEASDIIEITMPPGEYHVSYPSKGKGPDLFKIMEDYGAAHPDRRVHSAGNTLIVDEKGNTKFVATIQYSKK